MAQRMGVAEDDAEESSSSATAEESSSSSGQLNGVAKCRILFWILLAVVAWSFSKWAWSLVGLGIYKLGEGMVAPLAHMPKAPELSVDERRAGTQPTNVGGSRSELWMSLVKDIKNFRNESWFEHEGAVWCSSTNGCHDGAFQGTVVTGAESALWAWGDATAAEGLYIWVVGTTAMCLQYADTLAAIAAEGYYCLCAEMMPGSPGGVSNAFSTVEWVMKPVKAVLWAYQTSPGLEGKPLALGGHSGGGPASVAAGSYLYRHHGIVPTAFALQHPGAVPGLNLPGCASFAPPDESRITPGMPWGGMSYAYCSLYYPEDAFSVLTAAKVLVTCGTFCEASTYENSNWNFVSTGGPAWVANPSDCMVDTYCPLVKEAFLDAPRLEGLQFSHCGEHEHGVVGSSGLAQEGAPAVSPWLAALLPAGGGWRSAAATISKLNGTSATCVVPGGELGRGGNEGNADLLLVKQTGVTRNQQVHPPGTYGPNMTVTDDIVVLVSSS